MKSIIAKTRHLSLIIIEVCNWIEWSFYVFLKSDEVLFSTCIWIFDHPFPERDPSLFEQHSLLTLFLEPDFVHAVPVLVADHVHVSDLFPLQVLSELIQPIRHALSIHFPAGPYLLAQLDEVFQRDRGYFIELSERLIEVYFGLVEYFWQHWVVAYLPLFAVQLAVERSKLRRVEPDGRWKLRRPEVHHELEALCHEQPGLHVVYTRKGKIKLIFEFYLLDLGTERLHFKRLQIGFDQRLYDLRLVTTDVLLRIDLVFQIRALHDVVVH